MLDDNNYIDRIDPDGGLKVATEQPGQLDLKVDTEIDIDAKSISNVVVAGMGGSALAAGICQNWWRDRLDVPMEVVRGYDLPAYVDNSTLVVCSSYSGNTEETLAAFADGKAKGAQVVSIASGGKLKEQAEEADLTFITIPDGYQPRMAVWFGVKALSVLFEEAGLVEGASEELANAQVLLYAAADEWSQESATENNQAKKLAESIMGKAVWVYSGPALESAAYKWKIDINENAKNVASWNVLPEMNHNEFIGWTSHPVEKPFAVVELRSHLDHPQVVKRFDATNKLLSGRMPAPQEVEVKGHSLIEQILWSCLLGDFVSIYQGILNGVNPVRVDAIEKLKKEL